MKVLYFTIGAPGAGKTTFFKEASMKIFGDERLVNAVVSPDAIRTMVETPTEKPDGTVSISSKNEKYVWSIVHDIVAKKANNGELIIVDATHTRNKAISVYKKYADMGYRVIGLDFTKYASLETTLKRNAKREGWKFVPEEVIKTMYARIEELDIPGWVNLIDYEGPADFVDKFVEHFNDILFDFDTFDSLTFIGDIHGCVNELQKTINSNLPTMLLDQELPEEKNTTDAVIFIGDYFDRGYDVVGTFRLLQTVNENRWTMFLEGNHEEPLRHYKEFMITMTEYLQQWIKDDVKVNDMIKQSLRRDITTREHELEEFLNPSIFQKIFSLDRKRDALFKERKIEMLEASQRSRPEFEPEGLKLLYDFGKTSYKQLDALVQDLQAYPKIFERFKEKIMEFRSPPALVSDPVYHFHKLKNTSLGTVKKFLLSDITYTEVTDFSKRCAQMFYAKFHGSKILATHGGLTDIPTKLTPTADMVRGVGGYDDTELCDETFFTNTPGNTYGVHGHRNTTNLPIFTTDRTFNINGDVDLGIRAVTFHKDGSLETTIIKPEKETMDFFRESQLRKAKKYNAKKLTVKEEGNGLIRLFQDHTHVDVKKLPNNIAAINFTRKAFEKGIWDNITIKARGLFAAVDDQDNPNEIRIIARGYEKFFNLGEKNGFQTRDIRNLAFPISAYEKANGYLGIVSVDNRDPKNPTWFIASKTTTEGDFAQNLRKLVQPELTPALMQKVIQDKVTLVFEVIDPTFDPHIEEYQHAELVLLDVVKNELNFETLPQEDIVQYLELFSWKQTHATVRQKKLIKTLENYNDFAILVQEANSVPMSSPNSIEGYVFEDSSPTKNMFKLKTDWYSAWKFMRSMQHRIISQMRKNKRRKGAAENGFALDKSQLIGLKAKLHNENHIKVFSYMKSTAEADFEAFEKMSIIDIRNGFIAKG